jgi:hypothetical protein
MCRALLGHALDGWLPTGLSWAKSASSVAVAVSRRRGKKRSRRYYYYYMHGLNAHIDVP